MAANYHDIKQWFEAGRTETSNTHMIIVCDTFDWDDYPVYVSINENIREVEKEYQIKSMQKVMEIYNLKNDMETQLSLPQCFQY